MPVMKHVSESLEQTREVADIILGSLSPQSSATVLALQGDLGAGKTALTKEIAKILNIEDEVLSPTFVIMKIYKIDFKGFKKLIHIDAYRLEREEELKTLGWDEILKSPENLVVIEWPENVPGLIPPDATRVSLRFVSDKVREIHLHEKA